VLRITDTRTRAAEEIRPARGRTLKLYACGPTVYRFAHVGNMRTFLLGDLVIRAAEALHGWQVDVVQNITDVGHLQDDTGIELAGEDKILVAARQEGRDPFEIARFYEEAFHADNAALNIRPANAYPRASDSIELMVELISTLLDKGNAYVGTDGSV
jgi:cysteinyl-tRNA synthetase